MAYTTYRSSTIRALFWSIFAGGFMLLAVWENPDDRIWIPLSCFIVVFLFSKIFWSLHINTQNIKLRAGLLWRTIPLDAIKQLSYVVKDAGKGQDYNFLKIIYEHETGQLRGFMLEISGYHYSNRSMKKFFNDLFNRLPHLPISIPLANYIKLRLELQPTNPQKKASSAIEEFDAVLEQRGFRPKFSEGQLFLMSLFVIIMLVTNLEFIAELISFNLFAFYIGAIGIAIIIIEIMFFVGIILSLYHFFVRVKKGEYTKRYMYTFGSFILIIVGVLSGIYVSNFNVFDSGVTHWLYYIFPAQNILYGLILLFTFRFKHSKRLVDDEDADLNEILASIPILIAFIVVGALVMDLHWTIIFSSAMFYITLLSKYVKDFFELIGLKPHYLHFNLPNLEEKTHYLSKNLLEKDGRFARVVAYGIILLLIILIIIGPK